MIYLKYEITLGNDERIVNYFTSNSLQKINDEIHDKSDASKTKDYRSRREFWLFESTYYIFTSVEKKNITCYVSTKEIDFKPKNFVYVLKKMLLKICKSNNLSAKHVEITFNEYMDGISKLEDNNKWISSEDFEFAEHNNKEFLETLKYREEIDKNSLFNIHNCKLWEDVSNQFGNNTNLEYINSKHTAHPKNTEGFYHEHFSEFANLFLFTSSQENEEKFIKWYLACIRKWGMIKSNRITYMTLPNIEDLFALIKVIAAHCSMSTLIVNMKEVSDTKFASFLAELGKNTKDIIDLKSKIIFLCDGHHQHFYKFIEHSLHNQSDRCFCKPENLEVSDLLSIQASEYSNFNKSRFYKLGLSDGAKEAFSDDGSIDLKESLIPDESETKKEKIIKDRISGSSMRASFVNSDQTNSNENNDEVSKKRKERHRLQAINKKYEEYLEGFNIEGHVHDIYENVDVKPSDRLSKSELEALPGMQNLKKFVKNLISEHELSKIDSSNSENESKGIKLVVTGNSGTGKTVSIKTMLRVLFEECIILSRSYVYITPSDLHAKSWGGSAKILQAIVEYLDEGTIFIDDAHSLYFGVDSNNHLGREIVSKIESIIKSDKKINIVIAGEKYGIDKAFKMQGNLKGEFTTTLNIDNYDPKELMEIQANLCDKMGVTMSGEAIKFSKDIYEAYYLNDDFFNGKFVEILLKQAQQNASDRVLGTYGDTDITSLPNEKLEELQQDRNYLKAEDLRVELVHDFLINNHGLTAQEAINKIIGLEDVKAKLNNFISYMLVEKEREKLTGRKSGVTMHMTFTGSPGTGKTTMARLAARLLKEKGILRTGKFTECSRSTFIRNVHEPLSETVDKVIKKALGGVLFIDEVYSLYAGEIDTAGSIVINELVSKIENNRDDLMVIFAGYKDETNKFLERNPGLKSRIAYHLEFPNYTTADLLAILDYEADKVGLKTTPGFKAEAKTAFDKCAKLKNFSNGRFARNIVEKAKVKQSSRVYKMMEDPSFKNDELFKLKKNDFDDAVYDEFGGKEAVFNHKEKKIGF